VPETSLFVRAETPADYPAVRRVNELAFGGRAEADLVDALRESASPCLSLVAVGGERVVGHVFFSPVEVVGDGPPSAATALGPMAVLPDLQRRGVGSLLVREGLQACLRAGRTLVFVVGHPDYYPRFGFAPARPRGFACEYDVPEEVFMLAELAPGAAGGRSGLVKYHPAFNNV
jgi:putative acetyltransferase